MNKTWNKVFATIRNDPLVTKLWGRKSCRLKPKNSPSAPRRANKTKNNVKSKSVENIASSPPVYESEAVLQDNMENILAAGKRREDKLLTGGGKLDMPVSRGEDFRSHSIKDNKLSTQEIHIKTIRSSDTNHSLSSLSMNRCENLKIKQPQVRQIGGQVITVPTGRWKRKSREWPTPNPSPRESFGDPESYSPPSLPSEISTGRVEVGSVRKMNLQE